MKAKDIFNQVFHSHYWGNRNNAGVNYSRPYSKTKVDKGLMKRPKINGN